MASPLSIASLLRPPPEVTGAFASPREERHLYRYWRRRQLYSTFVGYAVYYFVRKNIPVALPLIAREFGASKASLGTILTVHDVVYGVSKFVNGFLGDRANARVFLAAGLLLSALTNVGFGLGSSLWVLGFFWTLNAWFQGMGFPPCARVLSHWFGARERGTVWGLWNTSHQVGAALILVGAGALAGSFGWRACFLVPAAVAALVALMSYERLRDTPGSLGLPPVEQFLGEAGAGAVIEHAPDAAEFARLVRRNVFGNRYVWFVCVANFFVYVVRYGFVNWAPSYLTEVKGFGVGRAGAMVAGFEVAGLFGSLLAGWLTDRFMGGRRGPVCVAYMVVLAAAILAFARLPPGAHPLDGPLLSLIGFTVYGPQFLVGVMTVDLSGKRTAATAIGLTGLFGYSSGFVSGAGLGWAVDHTGWRGGFTVLTVCAALGAAFFALTWRARPSES